MPDPLTTWDEKLHRLLTDAVAELDDGAASVTQSWHERARMWFVEVHPTRTDAAPISAAFDGDDLLTITVADTWFEIFPISDAALAHFGTIVRAVMAGRVIEAGWAGRRFARIYGADGLVHVGAVHAPFPWRLRRRRSFVSYC